MARATSSLPVPLSPVMSTQASRGATRAMRLKTACIGALAPTISSGDASGTGAAAGSGAVRRHPGPGRGRDGDAVPRARRGSVRGPADRFFVVNDEDVFGGQGYNDAR